LLRISLKDTPANTNNLNVALAASSATVTVAASGNFNNASVGSTGSTVPASAAYVGGNKSGNLTGLSLDGSGNLNVNVAAGSSGNAAAAATGSAVPASADYQGINISGTLRGQTGINPSGSIYAGQVDLASVAGTTADTNSGNKSAGTLRVVLATDQPQLTNALKVDGSAVTQPVSGTITANQGGTWTMQPGNTANTTPWLATLNQGGNSATVTGSNALKVDGSAVTQPVSGTITANAGTGTFTVSQAATGSTSATLQSAQTGNANGTTLTVPGMASVTFTVTVSGFTGTVNFEGNEDASNFSALQVTQLGTNTIGTTATGAGTFVASCASLQQVRALTSGVSAGNVTVTAHATPLPFTLSVLNANQAGSWTVTANAGTNLNTSTLALESGGNLATLAGGISSSKYQANVAQINGVTPLMGNGASGTGAQRVTIASDSTGQVTLAAGVQVIGALTANQSVNIAQVAGGATSNAGQTGAMQVGGAVATNNNVSSATNPLLIAGSDYGGTPKVQSLKVDSSGNAQVAITNTPTVTATNLQTNLNQVAGSAVATAATGVQKVGVVGSSGATIDSTIGAGSAPTNAVVTGAVYNSLAPAPTSGQTMALQTDQAGNIRIFPGIALTTLAAWNSGTSLNATQTIFSNSGSAAVLVQLTQTTTLTAGAVTFEVTFDNSNWSTIPASCVLDPTSTAFAQMSVPYTVQASTNKALLLNMNGAQGLRVKLSTQITGSGTVTPNYALLPLSPAGTVVALSPTAANFNVSAVQSGTWNINNVSGTVSLPTGAATAAKQPALGTAGSASSDVITVQGIASMTALKVDGSGVTQPVSGTVSITANSAVNVAQVGGAATDTNSGNKSAGTQRIVLATDQPQLTNALKVDGSAVTQPVSGTITANIGTTNGLALDTSVNGILLSQGSTTSGQKGALVQGAVTTNAPSYTTAQTSPLSLDASGLLRVSLKDTPANTNNLNVALAASSATVTVTATNLQTNLNQIAGSAITTAATGVQKVGVVGNAGATVDSTIGAGSAPTNAVVVGSVYNSSAPAPTNGQAMAFQSDQAGNIRAFPGIALATLSAWNSGTSLNATQNIFTNSGAEAVLVQLTQTTTLTAGAITFEVSYDNSNWSTIPANCVLDPSSSTFAQVSVPYTVQASTNKALLINMNGAQGLRIKLSTQITGSGTVTPNYALLPASPADTIVALSPTAANFNATATIQAVTGTSLAADQSNSILKASLYVKKTTAGDTVLALGSATSANSVPVVIASDQGAVAVSQSGTWTAVPNAATSGGSTPSHTMSAASTNATSLKASAGQIYGYAISNANASARYVKFYDKASSPTVGTDTPKHTIQIPGNGTVIRAIPEGMVFSTGIAWAATGVITDADTTAIGANDLSIDIDYK